MFTFSVNQVFAEVINDPILLYELDMTHNTTGWKPISVNEDDIILVSNLLCSEQNSCLPHVISSGYIDKKNFYYILVEAEFEPYGGGIASVSVSMFENNGLTSTDSMDSDNYLTFTPLVPVRKNSAIHYARFVTQKRYSGFGLSVKHSKISLRGADSLILKSFKVYGVNTTVGDNEAFNNGTSDEICQKASHITTPALILAAVSWVTFKLSCIFCTYKIKMNTISKKGRN